jgi:hypothetical protein
VALINKLDSIRIIEDVNDAGKINAMISINFSRLIVIPCEA